MADGARHLDARGAGVVATAMTGQLFVTRNESVREMSEFSCRALCFTHLERCQSAETALIVNFVSRE
jgi:hypothetical protein